MLTKRQKQVLDYIKNFKDSNGFSPSLEEIEKFLRLSSVSTAHYHVKALENQGYLKKIENSHRSIEVLENNSMIQVPILGRISAGQPILAIENKEIIAVPKNKVPPLSEVYALQVVGNSMVEENIHDGDIVLVHRQDTASNGQKVVALIDNNEATLKKFYKERGKVRLQPANRAMEPLIFRNGHDVSIQGIVLDVIHEELLPVKAVKDLGVEVSKQSNLPLDKIICGSAVDVMKTFPSDSIDLVVT